MNAQIVAVVVLRPVRDVAPLELSQPQLSQIRERAGHAQHSAAAVAGTTLQTLLELIASSTVRRAGGLDLTQLAIEVTHPRARPVVAPGNPPDLDDAVRPDRGPGTPAHRPGPA
ncbi:hypothetical protein GCM10009788_25890 [Nocardioides humi]|uniref:Uncharacterized protein n=1 Tax=Nocardioides humi TaxID=449461 RepID=A0ABN2AMH4_9ACTN